MSAAIRGKAHELDNVAGVFQRLRIERESAAANARASASIRNGQIRSGAAEFAVSAAEISTVDDRFTEDDDAAITVHTKTYLG